MTCYGGLGPAVLWTVVHSLFSKHRADQLAICSLFDKDRHFALLDLAALHWTVTSVFVLRSVTHFVEC